MKSIKKTIRNFLIYSFWLTGIPAFRRWWLKRSGPLVRVLVYHDVPKNKKDDFVRQIAYLQENYNLLTPRDFEKQNFHPDKINILLTFDDGYRSWADVVLPVLQKRGLGGIFFVSSGFIDTAGNKKEEKRFCNKNLDISYRPPLNWEQVRKIDTAEGCEIGGHTRSHPRLARISQEKASQEIREDKRLIEEKLDHPIKYFAFSYGKKKDIAGRDGLAIEAGYKYEFTTDINFVNIDRPLGSISRTMISLGMRPLLIFCLIAGVYDVSSSY